MLKEKQRLILNNEMELGENVSDDAKGKGRKFVSRFIEAGVAHYEEFGDVLITKETLNSFIETMVGCPVIIKHKDIDDQNVDKERVGVVSKVWYNEWDGWFYCEGIIWDKQAIDLIKNQGWSVSCTYDFDTDNQSKMHNGKKIDMEFTGGEFLHLALVPNPRYERANIVMNSKKDDEENFEVENARGFDGREGKWITVKGTHVFIPDGEDEKKVVEEFINKHQDKTSDKKEEENISDTIEKRDKEAKEIGGKNKDFFKNLKEQEEKVKKEAEEKEKNKLLDKERLQKYKETFEKNKKYIREHELSDVEREEAKAKQEKILAEIKKMEEAQKQSEDKKEELKKETSDKFEEKAEDKFRYEGKTKIKQVTKEEWDKTPKDYKMVKDGQKYLVYLDKESGATVLGKAEIIDDEKADDKKKDDIAKSGIKETQDEHGRTIISRVGTNKQVKIHKNGNSYLASYGQELKDEDGYIEFQVFPSASGKSFKTEKGAKKWAIEQLKKDAENDNTHVNNSKGVLIMTVFKDLEKFVKGVINNAIDKEEAENEDKRKLIDEVGGILKGKVDDEIIKTIMKKMEEASYEPSEKDKADNKAKNEEEEDEEKFEEEKEIAENKKAKNEEEEEEKAEEKEEEKEVKNKCKNSMKDVKKLVMGGSTKIKSSYLSKDERFALGEQY